FRCFPEPHGRVDRTAGPLIPPAAHSNPVAPLPSAAESTPLRTAAAPASLPPSARAENCPSRLGTVLLHSAPRNREHPGAPSPHAGGCSRTQPVAAPAGPAVGP